MFVKKFFSVILLLAIMNLPQVVSAEKTDWFDQNFYFRNIRTVIVFDVTTNQRYDYGGTIALRNMQDTFVQNAQKHLKCNVLTEAQARQMLSYQLGMDLDSLAYSNSLQARQYVMQNAYRIADAWIIGNVDTWDNNSYVVPERTVWEQRQERRTYYDRWGKRVYYKENISKEEDFWDPSNVPTGTYFWRFTGKGYLGDIQRNGVVEVIR